MLRNILNQTVEIWKRKIVLVFAVLSILNAIHMAVFPPYSNGSLQRIDGDYGYMAPYIGIYLFGAALYTVLAIMVSVSAAASFHGFDIYKRENRQFFYARQIALYLSGLLVMALNMGSFVAVRCLVTERFLSTNKIVRLYDGRKITIYCVAIALLTVMHITICHFIALVSKDMIWTNILCIASTLIASMFAYKGIEFVRILPAGAANSLVRYAVQDLLQSWELVRLLLPGTVISIVLFASGVLLFQNRCKKYGK